MQHWVNNMGGAMKDMNPAVKESLTVQDHIRDAAKMVALTSEQAQQIEEALANTAEFSAAEQFAREQKAIATIRAARSQKQAEHEPVAVVEITYGREPECYVTGNIDDFPEGVFKLYASPARTKDLTDDEIDKVLRAQEGNLNEQWFFNYARAVIAKFKEKNNA